MILSPGFDNNDTLQCISDNFPDMLSYELFLENSSSFISIFIAYLFNIIKIEPLFVSKNPAAY